MGGSIRFSSRLADLRMRGANIVAPASGGAPLSLEALLVRLSLPLASDVRGASERFRGFPVLCRDHLGVQRFSFPPRTQPLLEVPLQIGREHVCTSVTDP